MSACISSPAAHIYKALRRAMLDDDDAVLTMTMHPRPEKIPEEGTKADDIFGPTILERLENALGGRFQLARPHSASPANSPAPITSRWPSSTRSECGSRAATGKARTSRHSIRSATTSFRRASIASTTGSTTW